jgi:lactoylglutathione lyase
MKICPFKLQDRLVCILFLLMGCAGAAQLSAQTPSAQIPAGTAPRVNHLAITVKDYGKSIEFYSRIIGLQRIEDPFKDNLHAWFNMGPQMALHVIDASLTPAGFKPITEFSKGNHLCFNVSSVENMMKTLAQNKIPWEDYAGKKGGHNLRPDGVKQIWFQDPTGFWIEVNDAKE